MTDWTDVLARAQALDAPLSAEELALWKRGLLEGSARMWNAEYVHAVQRAVEGHDREQLDAMLGAEIPIPAFLLPMLASSPQGGRPPALTALQDQSLRRWFNHAVEAMNMSERDAKAWLAKIKRVGVRTISRSLKRTEAQD
jgi:hypothetical protein